ncbi:MAG: MerR family transcriptional regulator [Maribacter sp.]
MNNIKKVFSIRDLENLSGIKAHTIRIWEKRYDLLSPERTNTNIRTYSLSSLQKLLNISLLNKNGYKISKIAKIPEGDIPLKVREIVANKSMKNHVLNAFKLSMINFDQALFSNTYNGLLAENSFREIFNDFFIPLLNELGLLWQTDTISPAHEHFITALIKQKILINIEKLQTNEPIKKEKTFVLFLPEGEIHDIGLLYVNYEIILRGYKSVYLGQSIPQNNLGELLKYADNLCFLSYFTVAPLPDKVGKYINDFDQLIQGYKNPSFWIIGPQTSHADQTTLPDYIKIYTSIKELTSAL